MGHAGQPLLLERGALAARPGPTRRYSRTLPSGAPPGYSGGLLLLLCIGLALGSWIAIVPILLIVPLMARRTLIEENVLANALPGYADYMQRVRPRIVPGIW